ncbi:MAG: PEP-CTERM sorting domain-containing protein [Myxococcota bacterium]
MAILETDERGRGMPRGSVLGTTLLWVSLTVVLTWIRTGAAAALILSYGLEAGQPSSETLGGTVVRPPDAIDTASALLIFGPFPDSPPEDIDALHVLPNGNVVFSTSTDVNQGFGGLASFENGSLIEWNGSSASVLLDENVLFGGANQDIDAFSILPNGNWLLSTTSTATFGGGSFENADLVEYDPINDLATLYMGFGEATLFTGASQSNPDIDGLHVLADGSVVFSLRSNGLGRVGNNFSYAIADAPSTDLIRFDPFTGDASLFLDGAGLFDGSTRNIDAVFVPEPGTFLILGLGLIGFGYLRRRSF